MEKLNHVKLKVKILYKKLEKVIKIKCIICELVNEKFIKLPEE